MATSRTGTTAHIQWRDAVIARDRSLGVTRCPECKVELDYTRGKLPNSAEADHITPVALGGGYELDNGRVICRRCNQSSGGRLGAPKTYTRIRKPIRFRRIDNSGRW
ncbi:HNH endonuclease [Actinomyces culturomici]|uniref:HNH endonuclease n=1 Tax=Actinomyces culturomici TaxID=1926276 RepID=UPI001C55079D